MPATSPEDFLDALRAYFAVPSDQRAALDQPWSRATPLNRAEAAAWREVIWRAWTSADGRLQRAWRADIEQHCVTDGDWHMRYSVRLCGARPASGWPLLILLHDAWGARDENEHAWCDRQGLYPFEGMTICPRNPTGPELTCTKSDELLDLLIRQLNAFAGVDPNRVYLQGYGRGGGYVLQVGPAMADRWAAIGVAAERPSQTPLLKNLRSTPIHLQISRDDPGYEVASQWAATLNKLRDDGNPDEYICEFVAYAGDPGVPDDRSLAAWLSRFTRNPAPRRIVWTPLGAVQYGNWWLRLEDLRKRAQPASLPHLGPTIDARFGGQCLTLEVRDLAEVTVRLDDRMFDLDRPLTITINDEEAFTGKVQRCATVLLKTLEEHGDPELMYCAELRLPVPPPLVRPQDAGPPLPDYPRPADTWLDAALTRALENAGENCAELGRALREISAELRSGMFFLVANLPDRDLVKIKADFLLQNVRLAYQAWKGAPWSGQVPEQQFLQYILPFANLNERRDNWRRDFYDRFHEKAWTFSDPIDAAHWLNTTLDDALNVHYHAHKRPKSDQSPFESIAAEYASCTGLSNLRVDACRAVGIPARIVGVPLWSHMGGNHTWSEVWGGPNAGPSVRRWYKLGDTDADPRKPDWVDERCRQETDADALLSRVYATCFRPSELYFPLAWNLDIKYVPALNVTRFYTQPAEIELAVPGGGPADAVVYWNGELLLTASGTDKLRLPLAKGEVFRVLVTGADGRRHEEMLRP